MELLKINEIFYSLQMESTWAGTPAVFIRLSGCNRKCTFCDTQHEKVNFMESAPWILAQVRAYPARRVVITGGEPLLQKDGLRPLLLLLRDHGVKVHLETNGSIDITDNDMLKFDWITVSPKDDVWNLEHWDEAKFVLTEDNKDQLASMLDSEVDALVKPNALFVQPCWKGTPQDLTGNWQAIQAAVAFVKEHPKWRLSLQGHKMLDIP